MKIRYTSNLFLFMLFVFSSIFVSYVIKAQGKNEDSVNVQLNDKIELLENKIQNQQNEIEGLKKEIDKLKKTRPWPAVPKNEGDNHFRKWKQFEFNGQLYYMVPLNSNKNKSNTHKVK